MLKLLSLIIHCSFYTIASSFNILFGYIENLIFSLKIKYKDSLNPNQKTVGDNSFSYLFTAMAIVVTQISKILMSKLDI